MAATPAQRKEILEKNSRWFSKQAQCFQFADDEPTRVLCLARDHPDFPVSGVKQYACVVRNDLESIIQGVKAFGDAHLYEIIRADRPACGFLDVDFVMDDLERHEEVLRDVIKTYREFVGVAEDAKEVVTRCIRAHKPTKGSFHVLFPDVVFECAHAGDNGQKKIMMVFRRWCRTRYPQLFLGDDGDKFVVDTSVYSRNMVFRLPGNSKKGQRGARMTFVKPEDALDARNWLVQHPILCKNNKGSDDEFDTRYGLDFVNVDEVLGKWYDELLGVATLEGKVDSYEIRKRRCKDKAKNDDKDKTDNKDKYDVVTAWKQLDVDEVVIRKDEDFMDHLSAPELKAVDWEAWFLPVMASLSRSVDSSLLAFWCSTSKKDYESKYEPMIRAAKRNEDDVWVSGAVAMRVLRMKTKRVVDLREKCTSYVNDAVVTIEAKENNGWTPVNSNELYNRLSNDLKGDNRATVYAPRRCFFVTGKMGASKTSSVIKYAEHQLRTGKIESVLYVCPRTVLCAQTADKVEQIHLEELNGRRGRERTNSVILFRRFYTDSFLDHKYGDEFLRLASSIGKSRAVYQSNFDFCVVNSIEKLPLDRYDMVIADEPVVTVGNFYMDYETHGGHKETGGKPVDYSFAYCQIIRRAKRVFFVDAAFKAPLHVQFSHQQTRRFSDRR